MDEISKKRTPHNFCPKVIVPPFFLFMIVFCKTTTVLVFQKEIAPNGVTLIIITENIWTLPRYDTLHWMCSHMSIPIAGLVSKVSQTPVSLQCLVCPCKHSVDERSRPDSYLTIDMRVELRNEMLHCCPPLTNCASSKHQK